MPPPVPRPPSTGSYQSSSLPQTPRFTSSAKSTTTSLSSRPGTAATTASSQNSGSSQNISRTNSATATGGTTASFATPISTFLTGVNNLSTIRRDNPNSSGSVLNHNSNNTFETPNNYNNNNMTSGSGSSAGFSLWKDRPSSSNHRLNTPNATATTQNTNISNSSSSLTQNVNNAATTLLDPRRAGGNKQQQQNNTTGTSSESNTDFSCYRSPCVSIQVALHELAANAIPKGSIPDSARPRRLLELLRNVGTLCNDPIMSHVLHVLTMELHRCIFGPSQATIQKYGDNLLGGGGGGGSSDAGAAPGSRTASALEPAEEDDEVAYFDQLEEVSREHRLLLAELNAVENTNRQDQIQAELERFRAVVPFYEHEISRLNRETGKKGEEMEFLKEELGTLQRIHDRSLTDYELQNKLLLKDVRELQVRLFQVSKNAIETEAGEEMYQMLKTTKAEQLQGLFEQCNERASVSLFMIQIEYILNNILTSHDSAILNNPCRRWAVLINKFRQHDTECLLEEYNELADRREVLDRLPNNTFLNHKVMKGAASIDCAMRPLLYKNIKNNNNISTSSPTTSSSRINSADPNSSPRTTATLTTSTTGKQKDSSPSSSPPKSSVSLQEEKTAIFSASTTTNQFLEDSNSYNNNQQEEDETLETRETSRRNSNIYSENKNKFSAAAAAGRRQSTLVSNLLNNNIISNSFEKSSQMFGAPLSGSLFGDKLRANEHVGPTTQAFHRNAVQPLLELTATKRFRTTLEVHSESAAGDENLLQTVHTVHPLHQMKLPPRCKQVKLKFINPMLKNLARNFGDDDRDFLVEDQVKSGSNVLDWVPETPAEEEQRKKEKEEKEKLKNAHLDEAADTFPTTTSSSSPKNNKKKPTTTTSSGKKSPEKTSDVVDTVDAFKNKANSLLEFLNRDKPPQEISSAGFVVDPSFTSPTATASAASGSPRTASPLSVSSPTNTNSPKRTRSNSPSKKQQDNVIINTKTSASNKPNKPNFEFSTKSRREILEEEKAAEREKMRRGTIWDEFKNRFGSYRPAMPRTLRIELCDFHMCRAFAVLNKKLFQRFHDTFDSALKTGTETVDSATLTAMREAYEKFSHLTLQSALLEALEEIYIFPELVMKVAWEMLSTLQQSQQQHHHVQLYLRALAGYTSPFFASFIATVNFKLSANWPLPTLREDDPQGAIPQSSMLALLHMLFPPGEDCGLFRGDATPTIEPFLEQFLGGIHADTPITLSVAREFLNRAIAHQEDPWSSKISESITFHSTETKWSRLDGFGTYDAVKSLLSNDDVQIVREKLLLFHSWACGQVGHENRLSGGEATRVISAMVCAATHNSNVEIPDDVSWI